MLVSILWQNFRFASTFSEADSFTSHLPPASQAVESKSDGRDALLTGHGAGRAHFLPHGIKMNSDGDHIRQSPDWRTCPTFAVAACISRPQCPGLARWVFDENPTEALHDPRGAHALLSTRSWPRQLLTFLSSEPTSGDALSFAPPASVGPPSDHQCHRNGTNTVWLAIFKSVFGDLGTYSACSPVLMCRRSSAILASYPLRNSTATQKCQPGARC